MALPLLLSANPQFHKELDLKLCITCVSPSTSRRTKPHETVLKPSRNRTAGAAPPWRRPPDQFGPQAHETARNRNETGMKPLHRRVKPMKPVHFQERSTGSLSSPWILPVSSVSHACAAVSCWFHCGFMRFHAPAGKIGSGACANEARGAGKAAGEDVQSASPPTRTARRGGKPQKGEQAA